MEGGRRTVGKKDGGCDMHAKGRGRRMLGNGEGRLVRKWRLGLVATRVRRRGPVMDEGWRRGLGEVWAVLLVSAAAWGRGSRCSG
jgi:hypothetical protein